MLEMAAMRNILFDVLEINIVMALVIVLLRLFAGKIRKRYDAMWLKLMWIVLMVRLLIPYNFSLPTTEFRLFNVPGFEQEITESAGDQVLNNSAQNVWPGLNENVVQSGGSTQNVSMDNEESNVQENAGSSAESVGVGYVEAGSTDNIVTDVEDKAEDVHTPGVFRYTDILLYIWIMGIGGSAIYHVVVYLVMRRTYMKDLEPVQNASLQEEIDKLQNKYLGQKRLIIYESKQVQSPLITGILHPKLIIPSYEGDWNVMELELITAHELCHYRKKDLWLKMLMLAVTCFNWFNPAVYMMKKQFYYDMELVCDESVMRGRSTEEKETYAKILMSYAGKGRRNYTFMSGLTAGSKSTKNRIYHIWEDGKKKKGVVVFATILAGFLGIGLFVSCGYKPGELNLVSESESSMGGIVENNLAAENNVSEKETLVVNVQDYYSTNIGNPSNLYHIDENQVLWGCGRNNCGQLGQGTRDYDFHEEPVKIAENVIHVDFSQHDFAIYLTEDGELYGMGTAATGVMREYEEITMDMLTNTEHYIVSEPKLLMENVIYASCGRDDIVCLLQDGSVWILGTVWWQGFGGDAYVVVEPKKILENAVMVTGGMCNHAALLEDGSVWTWGYNYAGSCGVDGVKYVSEPVKVAEDVLMVWTGRTEYNSECTSIADFNGEYEYLPENTIILKEDGSYQACGIGLGEEKHLDVFWEVNDFYVACSFEFLPIQSISDVNTNIFLVEDVSADISNVESNEKGNSLLYTAQYELEPGRLCQIKLYGKMLNEYNYGISYVEITSEDGKDYSFSTEEAMTEIWGQKTMYTECWEKDGGIKLEDINFDGYVYIGLMAQIPAYNLPYIYYIFDSENGKYEYYGSFMCFLHVDTEAETCLEQYRAGQTYYDDVWAKDNEGGLYLMQRTITEYDYATGESTETTEYYSLDG